MKLSCALLLILGSTTCFAESSLWTASDEATVASLENSSTNATNSATAVTLHPVASSNLVATAKLNLSYTKPDVAQHSAVEANYHSLTESSLERRQVRNGRLSSLTRKYATNGGEATWANLQAGYGRIFPRDSELVKGRNGTAQQEAARIYVKFSRSF